MFDSLVCFFLILFGLSISASKILLTYLIFGLDAAGVADKAIFDRVAKERFWNVC